MAMAIYLLGIYLSVNLDSLVSVLLSRGGVDGCVCFWVLFVRSGLVIFLIAHLNQLSRQYLEESLGHGGKEGISE
ncbi:MAG: hypothetical protein ACLTM7_00885 [Streptococcus sp.]